MSLVNDMLRDLEDRGKSATSDLVKPQLIAPVGNNSAYLSAAVAFLLVVVLVLLDRNSTQESTDSTSIDEAPIFIEDTAEDTQAPILLPNYYAKAMDAVENSQVSSESSEIPVPTQKIQAVKSIVVTPEPVLEDPLEQGRAAQIENLMRLANIALIKDRLTSPENDNAFDRYRQVLKLDPNHLGAQEGMDSVAERYVDLADKYWHRGRETRARVLLKRALLVSPELQSAKRLANKIAKENRQDDFERSNVQLSHSTAASIQSNEQPVETEVTENPELKKIRNPEFLDRETARRAQSLFKSGKRSLAKQQVTEFLTQQPDAKESFSSLFNFYLVEKNYSQAEIAIERFRKDHLEKHSFLARLYAAQERYSDAIKQLNQLPSLSFSDRALLASYYNRDGLYSNAAKSYKKLLIDDGERPNYWLGLAVALDGLEDRERALVAFEQAASGRHSREVQAYIQSRIQALSNG